MVDLKKNGCLFSTGVVVFILLFFVADEIDLKWIAKWTSLSFEKEKFSSDMDFSFKREAVIEDKKTITLFGTKNEFKSENNKPIVLRTTDGGKNWKRTEIDIDIQSASFDLVGDSVYIVGFVDNNDSVLFMFLAAILKNGNMSGWRSLLKLVYIM